MAMRGWSICSASIPRNGEGGENSPAAALFQDREGYDGTVNRGDVRGTSECEKSEEGSEIPTSAAYGTLSYAALLHGFTLQREATRLRGD